MKWPRRITLVRHGESTYNELKKKKDADREYQLFVKMFERDFQSDETRHLAKIMHARYVLGVSDCETPLTKAGITQSRATGSNLPKVIAVPDVVIVSPYLRPQQTHEHMVETWPELGNAKFKIDDRIREQEHGLALLYSDWRIFQVFHPEQKQLYDLQGPYWYQYPQGESRSQVRARARSMTDTLIREYAGLEVMLITHHLTILSIRANYEGFSPKVFTQIDETEKPANCGVTIYDGDPRLGKAGRLVLSMYNKTFYDWPFTE